MEIADALCAMLRVGEATSLGRMPGRRKENGFMCPYLETSDPRCESHLNMRNLFQAYTQCAGCYESCSVFRSRTSGATRPCKDDCASRLAAYAMLAAS